MYTPSYAESHYSRAPLEDSDRPQTAGYDDIESEAPILPVTNVECVIAYSIL